MNASGVDARFSSTSARWLILAVALAALDFVDRSVSGDAMTWLSAGLSVPVGILLALVLSWLVPRLGLSKRALVATLGFVLFVVEFAVNMVEGYFFSTVFPSIERFFIALPAVAAVAFLQTGLAVLALPVEPSGSRPPPAARTYVASRGTGSWVLRGFVAAVAYLPVYLSFGAVVGPMVLSYYANPRSGLVLPPPQTIVLVELLRGALYVLALFPVLAVLRGNRRASFFAVAALVYVPGSLLPLVTRTWLPTQVIVLQSLELLGDALVYAVVLSRLMAPGKRWGIKASAQGPVASSGRPSRSGPALPRTSRSPSSTVRRP